MVAAYLAVGFIVVLVYQKREHVLLFTYFLFYAVIHIIFPDTSRRYVFPILWVIYVCALWPLYCPVKFTGKKANVTYAFVKIFLCLFAIYLTFNNIIHVSDFVEKYRVQRNETRLVGEWLSSNRFSKLELSKVSCWFFPLFLGQKHCDQGLLFLARYSPMAIQQFR